MALTSSIALVGLFPARAAEADSAPWAPLRLGGTATVGAPLEGELVLTSFEIHVLQQVGRIGLDADGRGNGVIAGIGGNAGLGLFSTGANGACADETTADGDTKWTCGQLTIGPTAMVGWAWGSRLETGLVRQNTLLYLRATPHLALVDNPERAFAEVALASGAGVAFRPFLLEATYIKVPGDAYVGVSLGLSTSVSGWLVNDREAPEVIAASDAERAAEAAEAAEGPDLRLRFDFAGQALVPVASADGEVTSGVGSMALSKLLGFPQDESEAWHHFVGYGAELRLASSEHPDGDSAAQVGPTLVAGLARFDGDHPFFSVYGRATPVVGWRARGSDDSLDLGATAAVGVTLAMPDNLDEEADTDPHASGLSVGLELIGGWMRGAAYAGAGVGLVLW